MMNKITNNSLIQLRDLISKLFNHFVSDSLFRNSIYLMFATGVMSVFGFFFWIISARLVSTESIGVATTLISVMNIISILSLAGFDGSIVRFLSKSRQKNDQINSSLILVGIMALLLSSTFVIFLSYISPQLTFIFDNWLTKIFFVAFCLMSALNILTDSVFLANRETKYTLFINSIFSLLKMLMPLLFFSWGAIGIFAAAAVAQSVGFLLSVAIMIWKFGFRPKFVVHLDLLKRVWHYCAGNYLSGVLGLIPVMLLPVVITNSLGPRQAAYYYIVMMIGNFLYVIPQATTSSLLAEGSHNQNGINDKVIRSIKNISIMLTPLILVILFGGRLFLQIFGKNYSLGSGQFLDIIALSAFLVSANSIFGALFRVAQKLKAIISANLLYAITVLIGSVVFLHWGLVGIGTALLLGNLAALLSNCFFHLWYSSHGNWKAKLHSLTEILNDNIYNAETILKVKVHYFFVLLANRFRQKVILFYPEKPTVIHTLYKLCHQLGFKMTCNPGTEADLVFAFSDTTTRENNKKLIELSKSSFVVNLNCSDISKHHVEKIFHDVFGYGTFINPSKHAGKCVKKSDENAKHDGRIVKCPVKPEKGYIYQRLIDNKRDDIFADLRLIIFGDKIPYAVLRYKNASDRFNQTVRCVVTDAENELSRKEIGQVLTFCKKLGMNYGELDTLRDVNNGKLYIVDANNTPAGPRPGLGLSKKEYELIMDKQRMALVSEFMIQN